MAAPGPPARTSGNMRAQATRGRDSTMAAYQQEITVRFGHCDPAAIVFYPRYFEMINSFVEDWFEDGLEASFPGLLYHKGIVAPTVHFTVDFPRPSRFGDRLTFKLEVGKIGKTSCALAIQASCGGELRMKVDQVLVFIDQAKRVPVPIPVDITKRMRRFLVATRKERAAGR
jgi:4-hydroxybenzoyl-CoA thioesterase